jgi:hypothetical protein
MAPEAVWIFGAPANLDEAIGSVERVLALLARDPYAVPSAGTVKATRW